MTRKSLLFFMTFFFVSTMSFASSFHCNDQVVSVGDSKYDVLSKCPSPDSVEKSTREVLKKDSSKEMTKEIIERETLVYDLGPGTMIRAVVVENGKVVEINTLGASRKSQ